MFLVGANIVQQTREKIVHVKIFSTFPEIIRESYIPAYKRVVMYEDDQMKHCGISDGFSYDMVENLVIYKIYQDTDSILRWYWRVYKLLAEGHYIQIWGPVYWQTFLPFSGQGEKLKDSDIYSCHYPYTAYDSDVERELAMESDEGNPDTD